MDDRPVIAQTVKGSPRLTGLDALRGFAALAVTWFHMTHGGELLPRSGYLWWIPRELGAFGHHGVTLFFILSGFVIPYSLLRAGVSTKLWPFLGSRLIRLQPPFLAACLLAVGLNLISTLAPGHEGPLESDAIRSSFLQIFLDNVYITGILGKSWILVVAWTLAIEVQFYLIAGFSKR